MKPFHTTLTAKAEVLKPNSDEFRAVASSLKDRYGFDLKPQMDILYVRSCLVSAGTSVGVNDNDDIFTREEAWAARQSPVLKPFNWQHTDKDIVGVMYTVQARSLDGVILDINDDDVPNCDFDLYVEAAIFRLIHPERAAEIESRSKAGSLYVSMEAWFDDYGYGFCKPDGKTSTLQKIVARNSETSFLDRHLRCGGGAGMYRDPQSNEEVRIGRVLKSITFGGCGFVDRPANKRSVIEEAKVMHGSSMAERDIELQIERLLKKVLESSQGEVTLMTTNASATPGTNPEEITAAVESALSKREQAAAAVREREQLQARATEAEKQTTDLNTKVTELTEVKTQKEAEVVALQEQLKQYSDAVNQLVQAGATSSTPAEIAAIDGAKDPFAAKIAWIAKSMATLITRATRAQELETQLAQAEAVVREQEVRSLLGEVISEEALETFVAHAATLDNEEYSRWRDEKELMVIELATAAEKKKLPPFMKKGKEAKHEAKETCANVFEALLAKRRGEAGKANPGTPTDMGHLINHPGGDGVNSGVSPSALKTPRHKIAGSAGDDPTKALENAQAESGVSLAGSQNADEGEGVNPFRSLAKCVTHPVKVEEGKVQVKKPGFDPVQ